jgi:hypothetical protein
MKAGRGRIARVARAVGQAAVALAILEPSCASAPAASAPPAGAAQGREVQAQDVAAECPAGRHVVWRGVFDHADWLRDWDPDARIAYGANNARLVRDERFGNVLRVQYPAGSSSSSYAREGHPVGGVEFKARLPGASPSIFLSYWLRFAPGFPWVKGGKLPGICGGTCPSGGARVSGFDGWSMRIMWRPRGAGEQYGYLLPAQAYGTELGLGAWTFDAGDWHRLDQELVLNTGGAANGVSRVWFDADPSLAPTFEATNLTYRRDETSADTLFFSTFFGGHDAEWATPVDTYVDFARFVVCR